MCAATQEEKGTTFASTALHVVPRPTAGATTDKLADYIHNQLDCIQAGIESKPFVVLGELVLHGNGPRYRIQGGAFLISEGTLNIVAV